MPNNGSTQFDDYTEEDFRRALESKPTTRQEYADILGTNPTSLHSFMVNHYPELWQQIRGEISQNRKAHGQIPRSVVSYEEKEADLEDRTKHNIRVSQRVRDIEGDVRTEIGRTVQNLKNRVKELENDKKDLAKGLLNQENLVNRLAAASTNPLPKPKFNTRPSGANSGEKPKRAVLLPIFDCQFGSRVDPDDTVGDLGAFNSQIFAERAKRYVRIVSEKIHAESQISDIGPIVIALGGDMVEGDEIFAEQSWSLEMPPTDAVILVRDWLAYMIEAIMKVGHEVGATHYSVVATPGNHGKIGGKRKAGRPAKYNWDVMVYRLLEERLANYPIHNFVVEPGGNVAFEVLGNPFAMIHGDEVRGWGSIPFYGMTRMDAKMIRTLNFIPDYVLLGHHHQQAQIPIGYGEWLMSGNWVGATSLSRIVGSNQPKQSMFMVDERHGVLDRIPILLDDSRRPQPTIHRTS